MAELIRTDHVSDAWAANMWLATCNTSSLFCNWTEVWGEDLLQPHKVAASHMSVNRELLSWKPGMRLLFRKCSLGSQLSDQLSVGRCHHNVNTLRLSDLKWAGTRRTDNFWHLAEDLCHNVTSWWHVTTWRWGVFMKWYSGLPAGRVWPVLAPNQLMRQSWRAVVNNNKNSWI